MKIFKILLTKTIAFIVFYNICFPAQADNYQVVTVCAKYENTGKQYKVNAQVMKGEELNRKTNSYRYNSFSLYAVIFWGPDQATLIEMDDPFPINAIGSSGKDQRGYRWNLSTSTAFCY